ncbi:transporter substrate-binding domain-containing protein, partial [Winslowiella iniecta]|uniref:transporter substrate-binding domain-containing protein n=2 Tax=Winslowiella iniecta TaxID=1560201 RepID=UPI000A6D18D6
MCRHLCCIGWLGLLLLLPALALAEQPLFSTSASVAEQAEGRPTELYSNMTQDFLPLAETRSGALAHFPVLNVGLYCCSSAPLQMPRWDGKLEGVYPDYLQLLQMVLKRPVQARLYSSWELAYQALQRGEIQLLAQSDFLQSANRDNETDPLLVQPLMLMVRKNHQTSPLSSLHILAAPDISPSVIEHLRTLYPHLEVARNSQLAIQAVVNDQADAYLDGQSQITLFSALRPVAGVVWRRDPALDELLYGFVGREGDGVVETINDILTNIPHSIKNEIYQRWVSGLSQSANNDVSIFTPQEIDWIKQHPVINVAIDIDIPPYSFLDKNDEITGLDVDILQLVAEKSGLNLNFIPAFEPAGVEKALREGKAQMTPSLMDSPARRGWLSYSDPYGIVEWVMITRNERSAPFSPEQLAHKRVAIQSGHALLAAMQLYPNLSIVEVASVPEAVDMMLAGAVDATFASIGSANYLQSSRYGSRIAVQPLENALQPERFAVLPAYPLLTDILNKSLHTVAPNEIRALRMHWFSVANLASYNNVISPWVMLWGGALCVIALSSVFWGTWLARQIGLRKKADRRLQDLLAWWETLFNNVPTPMFVC